MIHTHRDSEGHMEKVGDLEFQGHTLASRCWCALFWIPWPKKYECRHQEHRSMIHTYRDSEGHMEKVGDLEFQGHALTLRCWCALFWIPWPKEYECRHQEHLSMIHFLRYTEGHMEKVSDLGFQGHRSITFVIHSYKTYFHDLWTIPVPTRCDLCLQGFFQGSGYFKLANRPVGWLRILSSYH